MKEEDWQKRITRARYVERQILKWYRANVDQDACLPKGHAEGYDLISKVVGNVEVKEDRLAHQTGNYAIEYRDAEGNPSGLATTTAEQFVLVDWDHVIIIATESLKYIIKKCKLEPVSVGYTTLNQGRARGWLIPKDKILLSPYATVIKKWFK